MGGEALVYEAVRPTFLLGAKVHRRFELTDAELLVHDRHGASRAYPLTSLQGIHLRNRWTVYDCRARFDSGTVQIEWRSGSSPQPYANLVASLARHAPRVRAGSIGWFAVSAILILLGVLGVGASLAARNPAAAVSSGIFFAAGFTAWSSFPRWRVDPQALPSRLLPTRPSPIRR